MIRQLQNVVGKNADAMFMTHKKIKFGAIVEKDHASKKTKDPAANSKNFFFAVKERIATGIDAARTEISDYDPIFEDIQAGEGVVLITPLKGERYATDLVTNPSGLTKGKKLKVKTDGTFELDSAGSDAVAIYDGEYMDAGHKLYIVEMI